MWCALLMILAGAMTPEQSRVLVERFNRAQGAVEQQDFRRASAEFAGLVRDYGNSEYGDELRYALAEVQFNLGDYTRALNTFNQIIDRPHHSYIKPEAMYGAALSSLMLDQHERARRILEELTKQQGYEDDDRTSFAFGVLYYFGGEYEEAVSRLTDLPIPEAKYYLAKSYAATGRPLPALLQFKEITSELPNTPLATMSHFAAGQALFINHDFDGARAKLRFFVDRFPYSPLADYAHYFLGCALIAQAEYAPAIDHLLPLTRHSNNYLAAHANYFIGYAEMALDRPEQAVERFQRVRANYPNTKIATFANLELTQAMLATADTVQTLLSTSQLAEMFKTGELSGVGNYLSGVIFYQTGDFAHAADQFEHILVNYAATSLREPAAAMLLLSLNSSRQFEKSVALGARYIADYPVDTTAWRAKTYHFLADGYYHYGKYAEADRHYQLAYNHNACSDIAPYARLGRSYCLYHLDRLGEAAGGFKALINANPRDTLFTISAYLGYGYSLFNQGEYLAALDVLEAVVNTFTDDPVSAVPGLFYSGYCYYQLGYYGQAIDAWTMLMNRFPEDNDKVAEAAFRTGDTYFKATEHDKAIASFRFIVERHPYSPFGAPAQALTAQCFYNQRRYLDAVREYQKFLDLYPSDPQAPSVRTSLEMSYYLAGLEDSLTMEEFLQRFPQSEMAAEGQYKKGRALYDAGSYGDAVAELQKVVVNFPGSPVAADAQLLSAESYGQLERWEDAARAYAKFLSYFPDHEQRDGALFNQAIAYFNLGEYQEALDAFSTVNEDYPDSEYAGSARENISACQKRLGAGANEGGFVTPSEDNAAGPTAPTDQPEEGEQQQ